MGRNGPAAGVAGRGAGVLAGTSMGGRPGKVGRPDIQVRIAAAPASGAGLADSQILYWAA